MPLQQKTALLNSLTSTIPSSDHSQTNSNNNNNSSNNNSNNNNNNQNRTRAASPLDLSASTPISKRIKLESPSPNRTIASPVNSQSARSASTPLTTNATEAAATNQRRCHAQIDEINAWSVNQVCDFVGSIDICAEYVEVSSSNMITFTYFFSIWFNRSVTLDFYMQISSNCYLNFNDPFIAYAPRYAHRVGMQ